MVLPAVATETQISELELRLQVREELKQDYTFTNELLFIRECLNIGWPEDRVAREVRYTARMGSDAKALHHVQHQMRMLAAVEELRTMSRKRISYTDFDGAKQALIDLDQAYERLKEHDLVAATRLRTARIVGILSGVFYRDLRHVDPDFVEKHLLPEVDDDHTLGPLREDLFGQTPEQVTGTSLLGGSNIAPDAAASLLKWLTATAGRATVQHTTESGTKVTTSRDDVIDALQVAMSSAADAARANYNRETLIEQPRKRLKEARQKIRSATDAFQRARTDAGLNLGKVSYQTKKLTRESSEFEARVQKEIDERNN